MMYLKCILISLLSPKKTKTHVSCPGCSGYTRGYTRDTLLLHVVRTAYFWEWDGLGRLAKFRISRIQDSGQCTVRNIQIGI